MPDILHRVGIQASAEKVYRALTDEEGLAFRRYAKVTR